MILNFCALNPKRNPAEFQKIKSRSFANPFPEILFRKTSPHFRIDTLVERSRNIKEKRKAERKISFNSFQNRFERSHITTQFRKSQKIMQVNFYEIEKSSLFQKTLKKFLGEKDYEVIVRPACFFCSSKKRRCKFCKEDYGIATAWLY